MSMSRCKTAVTAAAAAGLVLVGCAAPSALVAGTPVTSKTPMPVTATGVDPDPAPPEFVWPDDIPTRDELRIDVEGFQYGSPPYPGAAVMQDRRVDGACTAGPLVQDKHGRQGFLGAGHCDKGPGAPVYVYSDQSATAETRIGSYRVEDPDLVTIDAAFLALDVPPAADATLLAGRWPVTGVLDDFDAMSVPIGTPICFDGAVSGVRCGESAGVAVGDTGPGWLATSIPVTDGDSGSPLFGVDSDGRAWILGVVTDKDEDTGYAMARRADRALRDLNLTLVTN
ncbi:MAG: S1 family peptidase [Actinomycetia bacterium]|nr:S1 family peptidase [Actinomycetes bacterium]